MMSFRQYRGITLALCILSTIGASTVQASTIGPYLYTSINVSGATGTYASKINDAGIVVGRAFFSNGSATGFIEQNGSIGTLVYPGANVTSPWGISDLGIIVGDCTGGPCFAPYGIAPGWIDTNGTFTNVVDYPGALVTNALDISNSGIVVGQIEQPSGSVYGYYQQNGSYTLVDPFGSAGSGVEGISADSTYLAGSYVNAQGQEAGFVLNGIGGSYTTLEYPGSYETVATAVDDFGDVVGYYYTVPGGIEEGFLYQAGTYYQIEDPLGADGTYVDGINDSLDLSGTYFDSSGTAHGYVATLASADTPEPSTSALTLIGFFLLFIGARGRRSVWNIGLAAIARIQRFRRMPRIAFSACLAGLLLFAGLSSSSAQQSTTSYLKQGVSPVGVVLLSERTGNIYACAAATSVSASSAPPYNTLEPIGKCAQIGALPGTSLLSGNGFVSMSFNGNYTIGTAPPIPYGVAFVGNSATGEVAQCTYEYLSTLDAGPTGSIYGSCVAIETAIR